MDKACQHLNILLVYTEGQRLKSGGCEKDLLVSCADCQDEIHRMSTYGKQVINLLPY